MRFRQIAFVALFGFTLIIGFVTSFDSGIFPDVVSDTRESPGPDNRNVVNDWGFTISQTTQEGVIDPAPIKQTGYQTTDLSRGRTDTGTNTAGNITIDDANGWTINSTEIEVTDLKRLYAVNGTFEDGTAPWTTYSIDGGSNTQIHSYNSSGEYIVCRNMGQWNPSSGGSYTHNAGSEVGWRQVANNTPAVLNFRLRFNFQYVNGPLDPEGDDGFLGDVGIFWELQTDGGFYEGWYYPLENGVLVTSRDAWYSITQDYTLSDPDSELTLAVGLYFADDVRVFNQDYDDDPLGYDDGWENAQNVTVNIDNIEFTASASPDFGDVGLTFHAGALSTPITGTGTGTAIITNPDLWTADPLGYQITASENVIFTYSITSQFQRYLNSSWTTDLSKTGVGYSITSGTSSSLIFYTYVTQPTGYFDATIDIGYPVDWENATVWDPLINNITSLCSITSGQIHVPTSEMSRSGWWEINLDSPNYAKNISVQVFDQGIGDWSENSLFRPGNDTRVQVEIGTSSATPAGGDPVNITWFLPDETSWAIDSIFTMVTGSVISSTWTFGSTNTTAGEWTIDVLWTNGTEIAFESVTIDLYHSASIVATYPIIETDYGLTISNLITYRDADTSDYLLDDSVTIEANWSSTTVTFTQNYAKNWWEADFDTALVGGGQFVVVVTASRPYFDPVSTEFTVISYYETTLQITNAPTPIERGLNEVFTAQIDYDFLNGTGIPGAVPTITFSGPGGGLSWQSFVDNNNGHYSVEIVCDITATYEVTITLSKPYHYNTTDSFTLIIGETGSELELLNGTADFVLFGDSYRLLVEYRNSTGIGLPGANMQVVTVTPAAGLIHANFSHVVDGYYEITLSPTAAGTYSVVFSASILNHETQYATFTITATGLPTVLTPSPSSASIAVDQNFTVQLQFQDESLNPIDSATVIVVNPPAGILIFDVVPLGGGLYNFTLTPLGIGSFDLLFRASSDNYQSSSAAFSLSATTIPTRLEFAGGVSSTHVEFQDPYQLTVYYYRSDTPVPVNVDGANLTVIVQDPGLVIDITEFVGYYVITIRGEAIGSWSLTISANKADHHLATKQFLLTVEEVQVSIQVESGLEGLEGFVTTFMVNIAENETGDPIIGATVSYIIRVSDGTTHGVRVTMDESSPGTYTAPLDMPTADGIFYIEISCEALNFGIDESLSIQLQPRRDITSMLILSVRNFSYVYIGIGALTIGLVYRRSARKRRIQQNKITLAIKKRFDDVRSLLGVIVIHKDSGLPVYSKILRDGLEEAVISAFITAITSFRGEFDIESSSEEWGLIPISDIIRVISTKTLICAFITTGNPSPDQRERMIRFTKTVSFIFDDTMKEVPIVVLDHHTTMQFDSLFDDILDGALLATYRLDDEKKFPTSTCADERIARKHGEEFKLEDLATEIASCGLEEGRVYEAIMKALDNQFLITTEESPFKTELIRAPESVEEES
ncbi:MAG: hypothetical protein ACW98U_05245 [Candidatus Thorarchaeota archaeon]|jgi:hypothetical protein